MSPIDYARSRSVTFWLRIMGIVVIACFALVIWTIVRQSQAEAVRSADLKAQAVSEVSACFERVQNAPRVVRILDLVDLLATNSILANEAALIAEPEGELAPIRRDSLERLRPARADLRGFIASTKQSAPSMKDCRDLAVRLGVDTDR